MTNPARVPLAACMMLVAVGFAALTTCGGTTSDPGGSSSGTGGPQCGACELNQPCDCNPDPCQVCMCTLGGACTVCASVAAPDGTACADADASITNGVCIRGTCSGSDGGGP